MAHSPIEQDRLLAHPVLRSVAGRHGATAAQVALAWMVRHHDVIAIPRAGDPRHVRENRAALDCG
jgi:diketogulonate reductase-like aldo/keto reductase